MTEVACIDSVTANTQDGEGKRKPVSENEQNLHSYDGIDEPGKKLLRRHGMLFHEFREIIES